MHKHEFGGRLPAVMDHVELKEFAERAANQADAKALWAVTEAFLNVQREGGRPLSRHTVRTYRQSVDVFLAQRTCESLIDAPPEVAEKYLHDLEAAGSKLSTIKVRLAGVRALYRALLWAGVNTTNPFDHVYPSNGLKGKSEARQPYSDLERERLLEYAGFPDRALILLCTDVGLSVSDCVSLRWDDFDSASNTLSIRTSDGMTERVIDLQTEVAHALRVLPRRRSERMLGYASEVRARQRMKQLCERADVTYRGVQALRLLTHRRTPNPPLNGSGRRRASESRERSRDHARPLTMPNYEEFKEELSRVVAESRRTGGSFGLLTVNIQELPSITQDHGTDLAQVILETCGERIDRSRRQYDFLARCHEKKFCLIIKNIHSNADLHGISNRFLGIVATNPVVVKGKSFSLSAEIETVEGVEAAVRILSSEDGAPAEPERVPAFGPSRL